MTADDSQAFAYLALEGEQFDAEGMPAATAAEVATYREAVYEIARDLILTATGASSVPAGFEEAFDLRLTGIDPGSARPQLILHKPQQVRQRDFDEWSPFYEAARDRLTELVSTVNASNALPDVPIRARRKIRKMGATLQGEDKIVLGAPDDETDQTTPSRAELSLDTRALIRRVTEVLDEVVATQVSVLGVIIEFDSTAMTFRLRRDFDSKMITCRLIGYEETLARSVKVALSLDGVVAPDVTVIGQAHPSEEGEFSLIFDVDDLVVERTIIEKAMVAKINEIRALEPGWWSVNSIVPSQELLAAIEDLVPDLRDINVPIALVPTESGGVVFEWRRGDVEYSAEITSPTTMVLCTDNVLSDELGETTRSLDRSALIQFFRVGAME